MGVLDDIYESAWPPVFLFIAAATHCERRELLADKSTLENVRPGRQF